MQYVALLFYNLSFVQHFRGLLLLIDLPFLCIYCLNYFSYTFIYCFYCFLLLLVSFLCVLPYLDLHNLILCNCIFRIYCFYNFFLLLHKHSFLVSYHKFQLLEMVLVFYLLLHIVFLLLH